MQSKQTPGKTYPEMSNHERFHVVYDGPALAAHRMDVRDLAPALVAIADLFTAANAELNGDDADVRVDVTASFKAGSFGIDLIFSQAILGQLRDMFTGPGATALSNASGILGLLGMGTAGSVGLIGLIRRLRGRRPHRIEQRGEIAAVQISETEVIEVDDRVMRLWRNRTVRTSLEKTLSPLGRDGITEFGVVRADEVSLEIRESELDWFSAAVEAEAEVVSDSVARKVLLIESVVFKEDNKWRVHDGQYAFYAAMDDERFLEKINAGERFGKGDVLLVDLQQIQTVADGALKTEYRITKVHEHKEPLQRRLL